MKNKTTAEIKDSFKAAQEANDIELELPINLDRSLQSIGKEAFVEVLFPALRQNLDVTAAELSKSNETYAGYAIQAQTSRLSTAKRIFRNGLEGEALQIIIDSPRLDADLKKKAADLKRGFC